MRSDALLCVHIYKSLTELQGWSGLSIEPGDTWLWGNNSLPSAHHLQLLKEEIHRNALMCLMVLFSAWCVVSMRGHLHLSILDFHQDFSWRHLISHCQYPPFPCLKKQTAFPQTYIPFSGPSPKLHICWRAVGCNSAFTPASSHDTLGCNLFGLGDQILFNCSDYSLSYIGVNCLLTILFSAPSRVKIISIA